MSADDALPFDLRVVAEVDQQTQAVARRLQIVVDLGAVLRALRDVGFAGPMRPDHGRMIWGEQGRPGYGLYDRALGAMYLQGLWEGLARSDA